MTRSISTLGHLAHGALRIITGFLFTAHGTQKMLGFPLAAGAEHTAPEFGTQIWVAGVLELVGGALILIGLFTRPVAFVLSGLMAFAYFMAHAEKDFWPVINGGELAVLYCFVFLFFAAAGGGGLGADAVMASKKGGKAGGGDF